MMGAMSEPRSCPVTGCERPIWAKGLCLYHYKRQRAGKPLVDDRPAYGSPSGFGRYGIVDRDETSVLCHECGRRFESVGAHLPRGHDGMTAREYRQRHGIRSGDPLICESQRRTLSEIAKGRVGGAGWRRLEAKRDPVAAAHSRAREDLQPRAVHPDRVQRARENGRRNVAREMQCVICGGVYTGQSSTCSPACTRRLRQQMSRTVHKARRRRITTTEREELLGADDLAPVVRRLQAEGVYSTDIAKVLGKYPSWMTKNFPLDEALLAERRHRRVPEGVPLLPRPRRRRGWRLLVDDFPRIAAQWHPTRNPGLDLDIIGVSSTQRVWWLCAACGHQWQAMVAQRTREETGCRECWKRASQGKAPPLPPTGTRRIDLTAEQIAELGDWSDIPQWSRRALEMRDQGVPMGAMARAYGVQTSVVANRLRRLAASPSRAARIRTWAQDHGYGVAATGALPREIYDAYRAAHTKS